MSLETARQVYLKEDTIEDTDHRQEGWKERTGAKSRGLDSGLYLA